MIYPEAYVATEVSFDGNVQVSRNVVRAGESWHRGPVVLSWKDVLQGAANIGDGYNVVLHEFAHQLDSESGATNGAPVLRHNSYKTWATVFSEHYEDLQARVSRGKPTVIDDYGTTNPAEFFAVATETFFEKPEQLHRVRPDLYAELQTYYQLDPRKWRQGSETVVH